MSLRRVTLTLLAAALPCTVQAQLDVEWVGFQNQTASRLFTSDPLVGAGDVQEKDYAWADVDNDGDVDLIVVRKVPLSHPGGKRGVLYMNEDGILVDRTAQYAVANDVPAAQGPSQGLLDDANNRDVVIADFNNDGWLDFATAVTISDVTDQGTPNLLPKYLSHPRIYMNQGESGGVWQGFKFEWQRSPTLYVLDASGNPNMAIGEYPGRFCALAAGDADGDGDIDLYFTDYDTGEVGPPEPSGRDLDDRLWLNDGSGHFTDSWQTLMSAAMLQSAFGMATEIVNINGVGGNEIIKDSALGAPQSVRIDYNTDADPQFEILDDPYSASPYYVSTGDLNNDGKLDMVVTDDSDDRYLLNTGNDAPPLSRAQFSSHAFQFADGHPEFEFGSQSLITDLNNDGFGDVLIADMDVDTTGCSRRTHVYHNLGNLPTPTLKEEAQLSGATSGWKGAVGLMTSDLQGVYNTAVFDVDGDGDQDLILGRCAGTSVWMNTLNPCPLAGYGTASPNSTGQVSGAYSYGSGDLSKRKLIFTMTNLPPGATGRLAYASQPRTPCAQYGEGQICLQGSARTLPSLPAVTADANGHARVVLDFDQEPLASAQPGDHLYFQFIYADTAGTWGINTSQAYQVNVCK